MTNGTPQDGKAQGILGLVLDVNGQPVPVNSGTITQMKTQGLDLKLTHTVDLGTFKDMINYIDTTFGVNIPTDPSSLPDPLNEVVQKVEDLDVKIVKARLKLPGTASSDKTKRYTLVMSVTETSGDIVKFGPIGLKGAVIGVTNEPPAPAAGSSES